MGSSTKKAAKKPAIKFPRVIVSVARHAELSKMAKEKGLSIAKLMEDLLAVVLKK